MFFGSMRLISIKIMSTIAIEKSTLQEMQNDLATYEELLGFYTATAVATIEKSNNTTKELTSLCDLME